MGTRVERGKEERGFLVWLCFGFCSHLKHRKWRTDSILQASSGLIKARKASDAKLDYSPITVELRTVDGLLKESTQCAPNGYYFIPVYDKGSFVIKINGPEGWSLDPDQVPVVVDNTGCNGSEDINFRFTGFSISGRVLGPVGGESCALQDGGPSNIKVELLLDSGDVVSSDQLPQEEATCSRILFQKNMKYMLHILT